MREIKFRAWDKKEKEYFYPTMLCFPLDCFSGKSMVKDHEDGGGEWASIEDVDLEQFTGLRDKNGKEIYEGDKVRAIDTNTHDYVDEIEDVVSYIGSCFSLSESWETLDFFGSENLEIIGNIHENPELLKGAE